ncbi:BTAD domain-containing putative transcriptional regulator [Streptomyces niveus]|uniref:BTAD domain-containing putative transcriptional regulator n=1 Tax=Streptomyces niveus TaxID=193462 RepID=UPI0036C3A416
MTTTLSRLGRQAEALELYERTRRHLVEEFGVDTAVELQRVHTAILRQEPGIGGRADGSPDEPVDGPTDRAFPTEAATSGGAPETGTVEPVSGLSPAGNSRAAATPAAAAFSSSAPFVGRGQELRRLTHASVGAATGHGHAACVLGPAGTGKTRLLLELRSRLENPEAGAGSGLDAGLEVVTSQRFPGEGVSPYWLWTQILRRLPAGRPDAFRAAAAPVRCAVRSAAA